MQPLYKKIITVFICIICVCVLASMSVLAVNMINGTLSANATQSQQARDYYSRYQRLDEVYWHLMNEYYVEVDSDTLIQGAIDGMMASLGDQYTFYYTADQMSSTNSSRSGNYVGIGVQVVRTEDNYIRVTRVFSNGPAMDAGLKENDLIISADGVELRPQSDAELTDAVAIIKDGEIGTYTTLGIKRGEEIFTVELERAPVTQDRAEYRILEGDIGYILLYDFFGSAVENVNDALNYFDENSVKGIILDLRGNPGGQLDYCLDIADHFLDGGVIVYTEDRYGRKAYYEAEAGRVELPLVILTNGESASASELLAAAIQEAGAGIIVGETTYGKGIVQTLITFPEDGAGMQFTTSAYYTANGKSIHKTGVTPDVEVINEGEEDAQLLTALEILWENTGYDSERE